MNPSGPVSPEILKRNLMRVRERIGFAASRGGRAPESVALIAVTKYTGLAEMRTLMDLGVTHFGESRVQDSERKFKDLYTDFHARRDSHDPASVSWHLIGHLQTNKADKAVRIFNVVHSVDSVRVAEALSSEVNHLHGNPQPAQLSQLLLEINVARERNKYGLEPTYEDVTALLKICSEFDHLTVVGLMAMAPHSEDPEKTSRPVFKRLRELFEEANARKSYRQPLTELSMGMTQDYAIAIEEGATMVRVGSALFGG